MTALSVNINKVALIRNSRKGENPNLIEYASACINAGADGITVHPRPDQRHVKPSDLPGLKDLINKHTNIEFNIEGNSSRGSQRRLSWSLKLKGLVLINVLCASNRPTNFGSWI